MGRKEKNKESKTEKIVYKKKNVKRKDSSLCAIFISIIVILLSAGGYYVYNEVTSVPDLPVIDINKSWSLNTTEAQDTSIRPYKIIFSEGMEVEIRWLCEQYRQNKKTESFEGSGWTYGINSEAFQDFFNYWVFKYNFRERAKFLNKFPHYKTNVQGLDIHYIHVKPTPGKNKMVLPILLLHSWPGSIREFYEAIDYLTQESSEYNFVFEVIVPSLPGYGFSQAPLIPGLNPTEVAIIMRNLMNRLGHQNYYVQGSDFANAIGANMATLFPGEVLGYHNNYPVNLNKYASLPWLFGSFWPTLFGGEQAKRMYPVTDKFQYFLEEFGYMHLQGTKPDTIGISLQDSPAGLASYLLDRLMIYTNLSNKLDSKGGLDKYYSYDKLIDNVMIYWISGSITTALRFYKEALDATAGEQILARIPTQVPTWGLRCSNEVWYSPDFVLKWKYPNLLGTTDAECGHFPAFETPEEFSTDIFKAVQLFLEFHSKT